jgi:hypothetical protein
MSINAIHLLMYNRGQLSQTTMLSYYPQETSSTLTTAIAKHRSLHG